MKEMVKQNKKNFLVLLLIAGLVSIPLMTDYVIIGNNTVSSLVRIENIYSSLGRVFPIRLGVLEDSPYGYSASVFQADIFYLIPVLFRLIGTGCGNAFKLTLLLFNILTAFTAFFSFRKCLGGDRPGLTAAMLYTWCPYRITSLYTSGNLSEVFAWTFVPIVILGLWELYGEQDSKCEAGTSRKTGSWTTLTWGFSLISLSSTVFLFVMTTMSVLLFIIMWRKSLRKSTLMEIAKTVASVTCINAWFLIPMLLRLRDPKAVGLMLTENIRGLGLFFLQYLTVFDYAGQNTPLWADGMNHSLAYGPGAAVTILFFVSLYLLFIGMSHQESTVPDTKKKSGIQFHTAVICAGIIFMILSTNSFPWDIFEDKNMFFSIILAMMENPTRWGIAADVCLIIIACGVLVRLGVLYGEKVQAWTLLATAAVHFGTTQFLLGKIMTNCSIARDETIDALANTEFPVIYSESLFWRLCEIASLVSVLLCIALWLMRRKESVKKI